jgi:multiple sugar transport system permease protein
MLSSTSRTLPLKTWALRGLVLAVTLLVMFPFVWLLLMSFKHDADIMAWPPKLFFLPTLENYLGLWKSAFTQAFANSAIISTSTTLISLLVGVPAAYALSRAGLRGRGSRMSLFILATRMAPPIAFTIPYFLVYRYIGLLDTRLGLTLIYLTVNVSLVIWSMRTYIDATPRSLEEAAWIDGATLWQGLYWVVLPTAVPGLVATAILSFLYAWNDFFFALILTRTQALTAPVAVVNFLDYEGWQWGKIAAGGVIVMLPVLLFSLAVRKFLVHGLAAGAIKG